MGSRIFWSSLTFCLALGVQPAFGNLIYDNGAPNLTTVQGLQINGTFSTAPPVPLSVIDSFTVPSTPNGAILIQAEAALWFQTGATLSSLNYCIYSSFNGTNYTCTGAVESGNAVALQAGLVIGTNSGSTLEDFTFQLQGLTYGAGTYWLQLSGANTSAGNVFWDQNNGVGCTGDQVGGSPANGCPSGAYYRPQENPIATQGVTAGNASESFQIIGAPEPGTILLVGAGLLAAGITRRKMKR